MFKRLQALLLVVGLLAVVTGVSAIVGGHDSVPGQFPYQASLKVAEIYHVCGATIVSDRWVVSAAHCMDGMSAEYVTVIVASYHITSDGIRHAVQSIVLHPDYNGVTLANDISMVQTAETISFALPSVAPIAFSAADDFVGAGVWARSSGWGSLGVSIIAVKSFELIRFFSYSWTNPILHFCCT